MQSFKQLDETIRNKSLVQMLLPPTAGWTETDHYMVSLFSPHVSYKIHHKYQVFFPQHYNQNLLSSVLACLWQSMASRCRAQNGQAHITRRKNIKETAAESGKLQHLVLLCASDPDHHLA